MAERYAVFEPATGHHWWARLQPHGFGHCFSIVGLKIGQDGAEVSASATIDATASQGLHVKLYFTSPKALAARASQTGGYVLDCTAVPEAAKARIPAWGLLWCVSCCKAALGVRAPVWTPRALAYWLMEHGAKEVKP